MPHVVTPVPIRSFLGLAVQDVLTAVAPPARLEYLAAAIEAVHHACTAPYVVPGLAYGAAGPTPQARRFALRANVGTKSFQVWLTESSDLSSTTTQTHPVTSTTTDSATIYDVVLDGEALGAYAWPPEGLSILAGSEEPAGGVSADGPWALEILVSTVPQTEYCTASAAVGVGGRWFHVTDTNGLGDLLLEDGTDLLLEDGAIMETE